MKKIIFVTVAVMVVLFFLRAEGWAKSNNFGSALGLSIKTFPPTPSIAGMGGIWAGLPSSYSSNPAGYVYLSDYKLSGAVYSNYTLINFKTGPNVNLYTGVGITNLGKGTLRVDYFNLNSNMTRTKVMAMGQNLKGSVDGESFRIGYGYPINDKISIGLSISPVYNSNVEFKANIAGKSMFVSEGKSRIRENFRLGCLYNPNEWLYLGLVYEYNRSKLKMIELTPYGYEKSVTHPTMNLIRTGISIQSWKGGIVGLDYLWGKSEDYKTNQFFLGIEQYFNPNFCIRLGSANKSFTAGIGLRWKKVILDYAYVDKSMKDMKPWFGSSSSHLITLTFAW